MVEACWGFTQRCSEYAKQDIRLCDPIAIGIANLAFLPADR